VRDPRFTGTGLRHGDLAVLQDLRSTETIETNRRRHSPTLLENLA
jgi:hypothetical protein